MKLTREEWALLIAAGLGLYMIHQVKSNPLIKAADKVKSFFDDLPGGSVRPLQIPGQTPEEEAEAVEQARQLNKDLGKGPNPFL